jgi:hypothetical protein
VLFITWYTEPKIRVRFSLLPSNRSWCCTCISVVNFSLLGVFSFLHATVLHQVRDSLPSSSAIFIDWIMVQLSPRVADPIGLFWIGNSRFTDSIQSSVRHLDRASVDCAAFNVGVASVRSRTICCHPVCSCCRSLIPQDWLPPIEIGTCRRHFTLFRLDRIESFRSPPDLTRLGSTFCIG